MAALTPQTFKRPTRPAETVEVRGLAGEEPVEVVVQGLDAGQRIDLTGTGTPSGRGDAAMRLLALSVVYVEGRAPIMDGSGWRDWSARRPDAEFAALMNVALRLSGFIDAGKG